MEKKIMNNDFRDWILFDGVDGENFIFDISKHNDFINNLDEFSKVRFKLALKEMLMNNTLLEYKKNKIYLLTSLGRQVLENGSFSAWSPQINSDLNINEKFSKNLELSKRATYITICIAFGSMIILAAQTYLTTLPTIVRIEKESTLTKKLEQKLQEINTELNKRNEILKNSLKKEHSKLSK